MALYPVFIEAKGRRVLVIGGGHVGAEKVRGLLPAEADITVVSPTLNDELREHAEAGRVRYVAREYRESDLDEQPWDWVMIATDDGAINAEVRKQAQKRRIWVNAADDPANCDFILPSVVRKGAITLAASTAGASPALARRLREELDAYLTEDMPALADLLAEVRQEVRKRGIKVENDRWQEAIDERLRVLLAQRKHTQARAYLVERLGIELPPLAESASALNGTEG
ncbi:MAG TPA: bifunctional precorrin-2 dehydrogenase/sirohydrochlorin ferrochelatase [Dehalococcoidia bacterium]|nr:bifunctional precorrin-2 dehydrogenase/sirohydrochlorin ferrochelatase [Dehalococcoidia bacterium]